MTTGSPTALPVAVLTVVAALSIMASGAIAGSGLVYPHLAVMAVLWTVLAYQLGRISSVEGDRSWLAPVLALGMVAKLVGASARYFVLFTVYQGGGDAIGYHNTGLDVADVWRSFSVPDVTTVGSGGEGTRFVKVFTGLLYAPFEPSALGGFWIFALLAFLGQFFLYLAFRKATPESMWKRYAVMVLFWPTIVYWPSSPGKEAVIFFWLGLAAWAASSLYKRYDARWILLITAPVWLIGFVRIHVAALLAGSIVAALLISKRPPSLALGFRRNLILVGGLLAMIPLIIGVGDEFGVEMGTSLSVDELDPVFGNIEDQTAQGGSAVSGGAIQSPGDIPAGILKVLFRPLPNEANNAQSLAASVEGALLLALIAWRTPSMLSNWRRVRRSPYLCFCIVYISLFVWAWSAINNLGILARQRSLVIPLVLAVIAALGWKDRNGTSSRRAVAEPVDSGIEHAPGSPSEPSEGSYRR